MPPTLLLILYLIVAVSTQTCQIGLPDACKPTPNPIPTARPTAITPSPTSPSNPPTTSPSNKPTISPSQTPSKPPTKLPSTTPTTSPTKYPTANPTTWAPTKPGDTRPPTKIPSTSPTNIPSIPPTQYPSKIPSVSPSKNPSITPTTSPSKSPTLNPSIFPTQIGSNDVGAEVNNDRNDNGIDDRIEFNATPAIAIEAILFVMILILFILMLYHLSMNKKNKGSKTIALSIKIPVLLTFISNILAIICVLIINIWIMIIFMDPNYETKWTEQARQFALIPYFTLTTMYTTGKFCLETFFILRVYYAFKGSTFELSKPTIIALFAWMFIKNAAWIFMFFQPELELNFNAVSGYLIVALCEVLFVIFVLFLFAKRLTNLLMLNKCERRIEISSQKLPSTTSRISTVSSIGDRSPQIPSDNIDEPTFEGAGGGKSRPKFLNMIKKQQHVHSIEYSSSDIKSVQKNLSSKQTELIFVITRCILLSGFAMITTVAFSFAIFFWNVHGLQLFILYALWTIDMMMNCVCLYLNFIFATNLYKKCCGLCHKACQNMFEYCTARKIVKDHVNELEVQSIKKHQGKSNEISFVE